MQNNILRKFNLCKRNDILLLERITMIFSINVLIFIKPFLENIITFITYKLFFNIYKIYIDERYTRNIFVDAQFK